MARTISRRRAISIMAAAAGVPLLGTLGAARASFPPVIWHGQALGAPATLILNHPDKAKAETLLRRVVAEVERLEGIFSLYRPSSALCELNRLGALPTPPQELVQVLNACRAAWQTTNGAFDPTIQPLWTLYAQHFSRPDAKPTGPSLRDVDQVRSRIGFDAVRFNGDRIAFSRPGMALTLNGIAQGFITDAIVDMLKAEGITSSLVDMGENRAVGSKEDGRPWRVGVADMEMGSEPDTVIDLVDKAIATTSGAGFHFDRDGRFSHVFDPRRGAVPLTYRRVTTIAPTATIADAFSTAFSLMDEAAIRQLIKTTSGLAVYIVDWNGRQTYIG
ncbi:FAD:protein FMN transferase [Tianweitania populi]|uniref:FAD:protein FMN transferase n=1 Tax=Tianweitania populi TaxID=1607949 RepID=A0A8J3GJG6_9HYPH|nr:FAD:protein FMN transferase [Tianweitania populi]GHD07581.1 FAD:protein FMN transferase [Tianweitania populi]